MPEELAGEGLIVTVVHAPACHFCDDAETALREMAAHYPMTIEKVDIRTSAGIELTRAHRSTMNPLVLVDGEFFSAGRLPRKKLARLLDRRLAVGAGALTDG